MADVPYRPYNAQSPSSIAMPLERSTVDADTFGASTGRALQGLGDSVQRGTANISTALLRHRDEQDANLATDANTAFMEKAQGLYDGYAEKTGKDAYQAFPEFKKGLDDLWKETEGGLQSDGAKRLFQQHTRRFYVASLSDGQGYAGKQFKAWGKDSATGRADVLSGQAALNINNPAMMQQFLVSGGGEIRKAGEIDGLPPEMIESNVQSYWGKSIKNIVTLQASDNPQAALATLQKYGPIMDPESRAQAAGMLRPLARDQEANSIVNAAIGTPNPTGPRGSQAAGSAAYVNNIGNLRVSDADWIGKGSPYNGFETFKTPEQGVAATTKNIMTIVERNPDATLQDLITTWAPASDGNSPSEYAATVAKAIGMDVDDEVPIDDPEQMTALVKAMARVEKGKDFSKIPDDAFAAGVNAVYEGKALPDPPSDYAGLPDKSAVYQRIMEMTPGDPDLQAAAFSEYNKRSAIQDALTETSRGKLREQLPEVMSAAMMGNQTVTLPLDTMRAARLSEQDFNDTVTQFDTSKRIGVMTQGLAFAPPSTLSDAKADVENLSGPIGAAINDAAGGPEGTGNQAMRLALQDGARKQIKQLESDRQQYLFGDNANPAAYVAKEPGVVNAAVNLQKATLMASRTGDQGIADAATRDYASAVLGAQAVLNVPVEKRRITTPEQAARLGEALTPKPGQSGEMGVQVIRNTAKSWGPAWPQVATELGNNMGEIARVVAIMPQSQNYAAAKLIEAAANREDLEKLTKSQNQDIMEEAAAQWKDFNATFANAGSKESLSLAKAGVLLTRQYVYTGSSASDAAEKAYDEIIGSQYDVVDGARIPKPYDGDLVIRGGETIVQQLKAEDLEPPMDDLGAGDQVGAQYLASVQTYHHWTTAPNGRGLILMDNYGPVRTKDGSPLYRTWEQLVQTEPALRAQNILPKDSPITPTGPGILDQKMQEGIQQLESQ